MDLITELNARLDPAELPDPAAVPALRHGWYPPAAHGIPSPQPKVVVRPSGTDSVISAVRIAKDFGLTVRAIGGGTSPTARPSADLVLDLTSLNTVRIVESELRVVAGAGVALDTLETQLNEIGLTHGHRLGSGRLATVGGSIATDAVGAFSGRYGRVRESVEALEWIDFDGHRHQTGRIGSDTATLPLGEALPVGIVTAASLRIRPVAEARAWVLFKYPDRSAAVDALRLLQRSDAVPSLARIIDSRRLILAFEGDETVQEGMYRLAFAVCQRAGGDQIGSTDEGETWWERRERFDAWSGNARPGIWADCQGAWARWSELERVWDAVQAALGPTVSEAQIEACHPGPHGVTLEFRYAWETDHRGWLAGNQRIRDTVVAAGAIFR
jgi:alkyldihydroxyacetonephosphate synthase